MIHGTISNKKDSGFKNELCKILGITNNSDTVEIEYNRITETTDLRFGNGEKVLNLHAENMPNQAYFLIGYFCGILTEMQPLYETMSNFSEEMHAVAIPLENGQTKNEKKLMELLRHPLTYSCYWLMDIIIYSCLISRRRNIKKSYRDALLRLNRACHPYYYGLGQVLEKMDK